MNVGLLTIREPWATMIMIGEKAIETRSRMSHFTGLLAIHTSATFRPADLQRVRESIGEVEYERVYEKAKALGYKLDNPVRGCVIGAAMMTGAGMIGSAMPVRVGSMLLSDVQAGPLESMLGNYAPLRYGYALKDPVSFGQPIAFRGRLGLVRLDGTVLGRDIETRYFGGKVRNEATQAR